MKNTPTKENVFMKQKIVVCFFATIFTALTGCFEAAPRSGVIKREPVYREPEITRVEPAPAPQTSKSRPAQVNNFKYKIREDYEGQFDFGSGRYTSSIPDCFKGVTIAQSWVRCKERHTLEGGKVYTHEMRN